MLHRNCIVALAIVAIVPMCVAAEQNILLDGDGKTVGITPEFDSSLPIMVHVLNVKQGAKYSLAYTELDEVVQPFPLGPNENSLSPTTEASVFRIPPSSKKCVVYNLIADYGAVADEKAILDKQIKEDRKNIKDITFELKTMTEPLEREQESIRKANADLEIEMKYVSDRMEFLSKYIEPYTKINSNQSVSQISKVQKEMNDLYAKRERLEREREKNRISIALKDKEIEQIKKSTDYTTKKERLDETEESLKTHEGELSRLNEITGTSLKHVVKMGVIIIGKRNKTVYYQLRDKGGDLSVSLDQLGSYPKLTTRDAVYAVILNSNEKRHPNPFALTVEIKAGTAINSTPVRPIFSVDVPKPKTAITQADTKDAYIDVVLPFNVTFQPNDIPVVTISTYTRQVTADKTTTSQGNVNVERTEESKVVALVNKISYPQVRGYYRYNLSPGIFFSTLQDPQFVKVQTAVDDPNTPEENEARYRIDTIEGDLQVKPFLAFSVALKAVDIQEPVPIVDALIPNPTIGFAITTPTKDFFAGFSHEIIRNTHFVWGWHIGKIHKLKPRNEANEEVNSTAPETVEQFDHDFAFALTFNVDFITKIFGAGN